MAKKEIKLESIGSEIWSKYKGAYGNMSEVMDVFMKEPDNEDAAEQVYQGINHQMLFYPAAYIVMPYLTKLLEGKIASGDIEWAEYCLFNIGMTIASDNCFARRKGKKIDVSADIKGNYRLCVKKLRRIAKRFYKENKMQLKHRSESGAAKLVFNGFGLLIYWLLFYLL